MEHVLKQTKTVNVFFSQKKLQEDQSWLSDAKISDTRGLGILQGLFCSIQIWIDITWRSDPFLDQDPWELPWIPLNAKCERLPSPMLQVCIKSLSFPKAKFMLSTLDYGSS